MPFFLQLMRVIVISTPAITIYKIKQAQAASQGGEEHHD